MHVSDYRRAVVEPVEQGEAAREGRTLAGQPAADKRSRKASRTVGRCAGPPGVQPGRETSMPAGGSEQKEVDRGGSLS